VQRYSKLANLSTIGDSTAVRAVPIAPQRVHSAQKRLGPDVVAQLVADYEAGIPTTELMVSYRIGKGTVLRLLESAGVPRRHQPLTPEQCTEAIQLYQKGWSLARIGRHFGRENTVIRDVLKRAGIPRRDSHGRVR
jgi:hypothetical protein